MPDTSKSKAIRVLLIEDNMADARLVEVLLGEVPGSAFRIAHVTHLRHGMEKVRTQPGGFDVVMLDLSLPDSQRLDGMRDLLGQAPELPIIIMTGIEDEALALRAMQQGAQDYLVKGQGDGALIARALRYAIERKKIEEGLRQAAAVFETTSEGILVTTGEGHISAVNPALARMTGFSVDELLGQPIAILNTERNDPEILGDMSASLRASGLWTGEVWCERKGDDPVICWMSVSAVREEGGRIISLVYVLRDITERKRAEETIWRQANYDPVTELPNRTLFLDRLREAMIRARRSHGLVALLFIDLDRFKWVNDTLGHDAGDILLRETATRLLSATRATDTVARLGGDEFTVTVSDLDHPRFVDPVARKILSELAKPFLLAGKEVFISGSIGVTIFPNDAQTVEELLRNADTAMYQSKEGGRNTFRFFTPEMNAAAQARVGLETDLRRAIDDGNLELWYQPVIDLKRVRIANVEALLRWHHPVRGMVSPGEFVPLAEESGLIGRIGEWALGEACRQVHRWREAGAPPFRLALNLSPRQFRDPAFGRRVLEILEETGADPTWLSIEVTEEILLDSSREASGVVAELRRRGVEITLDDFGTGVSSLNHLRRLAVDILKIDRSLVAGMTTDKVDASLVETIVAMGHSMGVTVIAEGVETVEQLALLDAKGCDLAQGYLFGRPVKADLLLEECRRSLAQARRS